jgi:hypothetical protein
VTQNENKIIKEETERITERITERKKDTWETNARFLPIFYWTD